MILKLQHLPNFSSNSRIKGTYKFTKETFWKILTCTFSETENHRKNVSMKNENCHYELQTHTKHNNKKSLRKRYGFNVYINEMNLNGHQGDCKDYVKFEV